MSRAADPHRHNVDPGTLDSNHIRAARRERKVRIFLGVSFAVGKVRFATAGQPLLQDRGEPARLLPPLSHQPGRSLRRLRAVANGKDPRIAGAR